MAQIILQTEYYKNQKKYILTCSGTPVVMTYICVNKSKAEWKINTRKLVYN